jgi:hypothetical protein
MPEVTLGGYQPASSGRPPHDLRPAVSEVPVDSSSCLLVLFRGVGCTAAVLGSSSCKILSLETNSAIEYANYVLE